MTQTLAEKILLVISILMFYAFMFSFIWFLMSTGREMNNLGGTYSEAPKVDGPKPAIIAPPPGLKEQEGEEEGDKIKVATAETNLSSSSSAKESVSESDSYWLWWSRRTKKLEDEEAANGHQNPSQPTPH